ncbi:MAG: hypothetical protein ISS25_04205 [Nanoarchaeota archaeon]|nr:hypothetical protein [DPANN group archaeon]MBL7117004.1 hypothetical protein [Nanoarchaeota archaeon]
MAKKIDMKKIDWEHLVTRRLAVQVAIAWNYGFGKLFNKRYRTGIKDTLVYFDGKKTDYFVSKNEHKQYNKDLDKSLHDSDFVKTLIPEAKEFVEKTYDYIRNLITNSEDLKDKELAKLYSEFSYYHANYYTRMWMAFRICERIVMRIETLLKKTMKDEKELKETSRILSIPLKPNDVTNERIVLLKIAIKKDELSDEELQKLLNEHTTKYKHIPMFDFDHLPYKYEHFAEELKAIKKPKEELEKIEKTFKERKQDFDKLVEEINLDEELSNLITMIKDAVFVRDYRDMVRQKLNLEIRKFYKEIGKRIGLDVKEVALLTNKEIEEHLAKSKEFDKKELAKRKKSYLLFQSNDHIEILSGKEANEKTKELKLYSEKEDVKEFKGIIGSQGIKKGVAKIVNTNLDFGKVKKGDIMVAAMTRQDFVSVMRKASAIVTNEGGVTCHAAIIARELGLPCIVGTEIATEVLKDGDLIEVDANKGVVRKL